MISHIYAVPSKATVSNAPCPHYHEVGVFIFFVAGVFCSFVLPNSNREDK